MVEADRSQYAERLMAPLTPSTVSRSRLPALEVMKLEVHSFSEVWYALEIGGRSFGCWAVG